MARIPAAYHAISIVFSIVLALLWLSIVRARPLTTPPTWATKARIVTGVFLALLLVATTACSAWKTAERTRAFSQPCDVCTEIVLLWAYPLCFAVVCVCWWTGALSFLSVLRGNSQRRTVAIVCASLVAASLLLNAVLFVLLCTGRACIAAPSTPLSAPPPAETEERTALDLFNEALNWPIGHFASVERTAQARAFLSDPGSTDTDKLFACATCMWDYEQVPDMVNACTTQALSFFGEQAARATARDSAEVAACFTVLQRSVSLKQSEVGEKVVQILEGEGDRNALMEASVTYEHHTFSTMNLLFDIFDTFEQFRPRLLDLFFGKGTSDEVVQLVIRHLWTIRTEEWIEEHVRQRMKQAERTRFEELFRSLFSVQERVDRVLSRVRTMQTTDKDQMMKVGEDLFWLSRMKQQSFPKVHMDYDDMQLLVDKSQGNDAARMLICGALLSIPRFYKTRWNFCASAALSYFEEQIPEWRSPYDMVMQATLKILRFALSRDDRADIANGVLAALNKLNENARDMSCTLVPWQTGPDRLRNETVPDVLWTIYTTSVRTHNADMSRHVLDFLFNADTGNCFLKAFLALCKEQFGDGNTYLDEHMLPLLREDERERFERVREEQRRET